MENGYITIKFDKNVKDRAKEIYKKLKRSKRDLDIYVNIYPKKRELEINIKNGVLREGVTETIKFDIKEQDKYNTEHLTRIFLNSIRKNDVLLKHLLTECKIQYYHKNLDGIRFNNKETNYFMDTVIITDLKGNNRIKINEIGFDNVNMLYI